MTFKLIEVDPTSDFDELIECEWASYETPNQNFFRLYCPIHGTGPTARADSLRECTRRRLDWHKSDPSSYWQKVVNSECKIVGGALWKICPTYTLKKIDSHSQVSWYPEGGQRDYVAAALERIHAVRKKVESRPQVFLTTIFTHPDYRHQGVADLMMNWGIQKADQMGVEMWLNATVYGLPLYKKHGFTVVDEIDASPIADNASDEWRNMARRSEPMNMWQMWRPVGG
ncbi:acetyltransferase (GNAT) domain-containing protein [Hirsutella rhossiliensis]|uniref:Acetyltransferase (GNAT) domain-containing protein n=1 Tax=Hirsutella rhossiliensis TaxID=111463 RepID=A0A9P8MU83_9HYPO|nr:acetyltransferase (GNAT) domain-containing protein [Hirsutella rhossiliensis]KAH0962213.1 acetyltransferase (GNAT) domain-containing protein [Hirsutella rhossiliensis]